MNNADPAWMRWADDPNALYGIIVENMRSITRDPANALWYREQNAEIETYLRRFHGE